MLAVLLEEHRVNFRNLLSNAAALTQARTAGSVLNSNLDHLLKFYAAEVGLKYLLNAVNKIPFKHELTAKGISVENYSHFLSDMVTELKIPAARVPQPPKQRYQCMGGYNDGNGGQEFELHQSHEAWRYGLTMKSADETEIIDYIVGITRYLEQEIPA